jgi:predicted metal-dependent hydrolase
MHDDLPEQYREGLRLFNAEDFFECHEILEELWGETQGEPKKFVQGLIQAAVALFHFGNENFGGAKKLYISASEKLQPYGDEYMGIALATFLADFRACFQELLDNTESYPTTVALRDELVPKIRWSSGEIVEP